MQYAATRISLILYKKLKEILKDNNENVKSFFDLLNVQLKSKNAQVCTLKMIIIHTKFIFFC